MRYTEFDGLIAKMKEEQTKSFSEDRAKSIAAFEKLRAIKKEQAKQWREVAIVTKMNNPSF